jgi:hypothetical protein
MCYIEVPFKEGLTVQIWRRVLLQKYMYVNNKWLAQRCILRANMIKTIEFIYYLYSEDDEH